MNLDQSQIPDNIDTVEKLAAWCIVLLQRMNPTQKALEAENYSDFVCQVGLVVDPTGVARFIGRLNLELAADYQTSGKKFWENIKEISEIAIPAGYTS